MALSSYQTSYTFPKVKPGTWMRRHLFQSKADIKGGKNGTISGNYHHFIIINPLFSIGYDGEAICFDSHFKTNQEKSAIWPKYNFEQWEIISVPKDKCAAEECITKALWRLCESDYGLITNNCEHFCRDCCKGQNYSRQVREILGVSGVTLFSALGGGIGGGALAPAAASATFLGSKILGGWAVSVGVMSAPAAPAVLPFILGGVVIFSLVGYVGSKSVAIATKEKTSKAKTEKKQQESLFALYQKHGLDVITAMCEEVIKVKEHKQHMYVFCFQNYKDTVDKYWFD
eukprot:16253_1